MMQPGGAGARPQVPALPAGEPACSRGIVMYQIVRVNDPPGKVVLRKMSGVKVHITPNCTWAHYTVRSLRSQLAEFDVFDDVSENSGGWATKSFVASHISVVVGVKVAASNQLVAALWDSYFFDYEILAAQPPIPESSRFEWELEVRQPATDVVYGVKLPEDKFRKLTCRGLTWIINGENYQKFEPEDRPAYHSGALRPPQPYWDLKWPERYGPGYRVQVDPVREGLAMADPLSRIVVAQRVTTRVVIPPDRLVHDVVQNQLYWDAASNKFTNWQLDLLSS